ncbi:MAG: [FeFe] hydrogenase, group A [Thermoguttaceae bacterium]
MQITRRKVLRGSAVGAGLLVADCLCNGSTCFSQQQRGPQLQSSPQQGQGPGAARLRNPLPLKNTNPAIVHDPRRCRRCGRCVEFCKNVTTVCDRPVPNNEEACTYCGQCTFLCRGGAINERFHYPLVRSTLAENKKITVASTSPAVRIALGEMFKQQPGVNLQQKIVQALRQLGFSYVLDTTFAADLTVMEETAELLERLENKRENSLPLLTSCCPAWVRFARLFYPQYVRHLSTCKSPVMMQGVMLKTFFAQQQGLDPANIFHVAITPCTAKKAEILLPDMNSPGLPLGKPEIRDVDVALTTRELGYMLGEARMDLLGLEDGEYDSMLSGGSGAGLIFGNTGGVMEATVRNVYRRLNGVIPPKELFNLQPIRGLDAVREATVDLGPRKINVAVVHGLRTVRTFLDALKNNEMRFDFVEIMACPGGCVGGGGQPRNAGPLNDLQLKFRRMNGLYEGDEQQAIRLSCDNPAIERVYSEFLESPLSERAKQLLHRGERR